MMKICRIQSDETTEKIKDTFWSTLLQPFSQREIEDLRTHPNTFICLVKFKLFRLLEERKKGKKKNQEACNKCFCCVHQDQIVHVIIAHYTVLESLRFNTSFDRKCATFDIDDTLLENVLHKWKYAIISKLYNS